MPTALRKKRHGSIRMPRTHAHFKRAVAPLADGFEAIADTIDPFQDGSGDVPDKSQVLPR
jgi:hypothetical protein